MAILRATLIDVGWGDSILIESRDHKDEACFALIDSNDRSTDKSSYIFLKRFFERRGFTIPTVECVFEWVLLTHAHGDHGRGLKTILHDSGAKRFWYTDPRNPPGFLADLLRYARHAPPNRVGQHDIINTGQQLPPFGPASMQVLWPTPGLKPANENDNSAVLTITLGNACFILTGDAEADGVWTRLAASIPTNTSFFKVPHHGSDNGTFTSTGSTPWLTKLPQATKLAISSHIRPHRHPNANVLARLTQRGFTYRTDEHYHITIETDGQKTEVQYSHI